jgi:hypothetical protein
MKTIGGTEQEMKIDKTYEVYQATVSASSLRCIGRDSGNTASFAHSLTLLFFALAHRQNILLIITHRRSDPN